MAGVPLGRASTPIEVANLIAFLLSDESRIITGSIYTIDGVRCRTSLPSAELSILSRIHRDEPARVRRPSSDQDYFRYLPVNKFRH